MTAWFALRTAPMKEFAVEEILRLRGVTCFVPTEVKWRRHGRKKTPVARPLLPRYLFIRCPDPWDIVRAMQGRGVCGVVCFDGVPAAIPERAVESLASRSGAAVPTRSARVHRAFTAGEKVEIVSGPFQGWCVELTEIKGDVGRVLLKMFGTERTVEVSVSQLEAA